MTDRIARNRGLVSYANWKVATVALVAKALGMRVCIEGFPFGGHRGPEPFRNDSTPPVGLKPVRRQSDWKVV